MTYKEIEALIKKFGEAQRAWYQNQSSNEKLKKVNRLSKKCDHALRNMMGSPEKEILRAKLLRECWSTIRVKAKK